MGPEVRASEASRMLSINWEIWGSRRGLHSFRQYGRHAGSLGSLWEVLALRGRRIHPVCTNNMHVVLCPRLCCHSWFPHRPAAVVQFSVAVLYRLGAGCQPESYLLSKTSTVLLKQAGQNTLRALIARKESK